MSRNGFHKHLSALHRRLFEQRTRIRIVRRALPHTSLLNDVRWRRMAIAVRSDQAIYICYEPLLAPSVTLISRSKHLMAKLAAKSLQVVVSDQKYVRNAARRIQPNVPCTTIDHARVAVGAGKGSNSGNNCGLGRQAMSVSGSVLASTSNKWSFEKPFDDLHHVINSDGYSVSFYHSVLGFLPSSRSYNSIVTNCSCSEGSSYGVMKGTLSRNCRGHLRLACNTNAIPCEKEVPQ